ncbi:NADH-quinone oxidoreductase subunit NuoF [Abyssisolibacter fermentans]|uniref:NADH-quinone oxidoreductase subunit NuoF n=1 Tax=Abyssisolibacter fermentans TaxID=1766203 RepID=UPI00082F77C0|nr:NADH-quinone oxidoreductase subunit NuoF [Abyssisolibacter fermentans]
MVNLLSKLCGKINPLSIDDYVNNEGFKAIKKALYDMSPQQVLSEVKNSNLRGRGGAAFPTGLKWSFTASEKSPIKYVICNADEGEPGTFKDRILLDGSPFQIIEGMMICGYAVGATKGYIYIRGEYSKTKEMLIKGIEILREAGCLGNNIFDSSFDFDIEVRSGAGAYVCGEETALIESIEGKPGRTRFKPPYPPVAGLWNKPTLVNNVETLANIPVILNLGAEEFKQYGTPSSSGTKLISVSGSIVNKGVFEIEFGISIREIINNLCGGIDTDKKVKFVQLGGSSGACIPESMLDIKIDFDCLKENGVSLGSGAMFIADEDVCIVDFLMATMEFFKHESCGKCTPCREGNKHIVRILNKITKGVATQKDLEILYEICNVMKTASLCGLGQAAPTAVISCLEHFRDEINEHINKHCRAGNCLFNKGVSANE